VGKIKLVLAQKEMGEKDLARATGLKADEILQLLTRQRKLDFETLEDIATALGVSIEFFFKEEDRDEFAKLLRDPRLTEAENAVLVERLSEMREALAELLLKKRQKSHARDFVAGCSYLPHFGKSFNLLAKQQQLPGETKRLPSYGKDYFCTNCERLKAKDFPCIR
jgi:transcriptional regulator with XRE-family HTH domain